MKRDKWKKRIIQRSDMASRITHLTRGKTSKEAFENLWKILVDKKLEGSSNTGFINGKEKRYVYKSCLCRQWQKICFMNGH